jgi:hypothetical protein
MADARWRVRAGDPDFGPICPLCAAPKTLQARKCRACETDRIRALAAELPPRPGRKRKSRAKANPIVSAHNPNHPWRRADHARVLATGWKPAA